MNAAMKAPNEKWTIVTMSHGDLALDLLPGIGGRLWDIRFEDTSLLFQNPDLWEVDAGIADLTQLPTRTPQYPFPLWGGEKTWIAPEGNWPDGAPFRDLDNGAYSLLIQQNSAMMVSPICRQSGIEITRHVELSDAAAFRIRTMITNKGDRTIDASPWSVMMLRKPLRVAFECAHPPALVFGQAENAIAYEKNHAEVVCGDGSEFKVNAKLLAPCAQARLGAILLESRVEHALDEPMPKGHQSLEIYNARAYDYGELEWIAPLRSLLPGESHDLVVNYTIRREP